MKHFNTNTPVERLLQFLEQGGVIRMNRRAILRAARELGVTLHQLSLAIDEGTGDGRALVRGYLLQAIAFPLLSTDFPEDQKQ